MYSEIIFIFNTQNYRNLPRIRKCKHRNTKHEITHENLLTFERGRVFSTDICRPFMMQIKSQPKKVYVFSFIDNRTGFTKLQIISNIQANQVINAFERSWIKLHGPPNIIICYHGAQYTSKLFAYPLILIILRSISAQLIINKGILS